ncbi:MAG: DUF4145 domain-containing protein [Nanoarchaeota archaeon]
MTLETFKKALGNVRFAVDKAQTAGVSLLDATRNSLDFKSQKNAHLARDVVASVNVLEKEGKALHGLAEEDSDVELKVIDMMKMIRTMKESIDLGVIRDGAHHLRNAISDLSVIKNEQFHTLDVKIPNIPADVRSDMERDLAEIKRCFDAECYRSVAILCGRLLEIALHRKYFDVTGTDLLEKAPGTGLGNMIKKLSEHSVIVDAGLMNQIHVINQVRVHSVHVKREAYNVSKDQAHAMALYTVDVVKKLFT